MPRKRFPENKYIVPRRDQIEQISIVSMQAVSDRLPGLESWKLAKTRKRPVKIYDINGKLLFLDYPVVHGRKVVGKVRSAASKVLGYPVISLIREMADVNYAKSLEVLNARVNKEYRGWRILRTRLVCYSYPKLGVMFNMVNPSGKRQRLIFDIASFDLIPEATRETKGREGAYAWSFYDALPDDVREANINRFQEYDNARLRIPEATRKLITSYRSLTAINELVLPQISPWKTTTKELQFCPHYDYTEARSHHCFVLHGQQVNDYCAVATCQMILCYYRYYYTQDQIAPELNYSSGNGCPPDQSGGYESLSDNHINATYDTSPTWNEAKAQIDGLRPFKSGIPGHARACAGYSYTSWYNLPLTRSLYIYDPSPWNADYKLAGSIHWETWGSVTLTNFVKTELQY